MSGLLHKADFRTRLYSALVLAVVALVLTWHGVWAFAGLVLLVGLGMSWEWGRLVRGQGFDQVFWSQAITVSVAVWLTAYGCADAGLSILLAGAALIYAAVAISGRVPWSSLGVLYVGVPVTALVWLRGDPDFGLLAILYLFTIIWATDSFAYVCGKVFGGPRLAPTVSPGKTWAGLVGGLVAGGASGVVFGLLMGGTSPLALGALGLVLSLCGQVGDLAESAIKRMFGRKDASGLIPGHGGLMDRVDALGTAAIVAAAIALMVEPSRPGAGLLVWLL